MQAETERAVESLWEIEFSVLRCTASRLSLCLLSPVRRAELRGIDDGSPEPDSRCARREPAARRRYFPKVRHALSGVRLPHRCFARVAWGTAFW